MADDVTSVCLGLLRTNLPDLEIDRWEQYNGQFNDVLIVNDDLVARFPRSASAAAAMEREVVVLNALRGRLPLPIPEPVVVARNLEGQQTWMSYRIIPGVPLDREQMATLDHAAISRIAAQLAEFLRELHHIRLSDLPAELTADVSEDRGDWLQMWADICDLVSPHMRADRFDAVAADWETYLADERHFAFVPTLRHGDFGIGNLLFDPETGVITGIIDFSFCGLGDPAQDLGALLASFDPAFVERVFVTYPELRSGRDRAEFYTRTYALQQALDGLRDGDDEAFEDGISAYR
jgi:aminoglycoside 2''-phosphotransferase